MDMYVLFIEEKLREKESHYVEAKSGYLMSGCS